MHGNKLIINCDLVVVSMLQESVVARCFDLKDAGNLRQLIGDRKDCDDTNYKSVSFLDIKH